MGNLNMENPFANYGAILIGDRFIGRKDALRLIESRVIKPKDAGNLAIIGEPRIGKSSLVHKAIMEQKNQLIEKKIIPLWINIGTYDNPTVFFRSLVTICRDELEVMDSLTQKIALAAQKSLEERLSWSEGYSRIQRFFERVKSEGYRIIIVLDEFDHARILFKNEISAFQGLRELSYRPEWKVTFVTTSRRSIRDIEVQSGAISTLDGIFYKHCLSMFNNEDIQEFYNKFALVGIDLNEQDIQQMQYFCGAHPYFNEMLGFEMVELFCDNGIVDVDKAARNLLRTLVDEYEKIVSLLKEDGSLEKLLQILFGPMVSARQTDIDEFLKYGLIYRLNDEYKAFSGHFHQYLSLVAREIDLWPLFAQTERAIRRLLSHKMTEKYGERWIEEIEEVRPHIKASFDEARLTQERDMKSFQNRASRSLLDYTHLSLLFSIIVFEWKDTFKDIFMKDINYWQQRFDYISKVRNPMAHNRDEILQEHERVIAEGFCKEILSITNSIDMVGNCKSP